MIEGHDTRYLQQIPTYGLHRDDYAWDKPWTKEALFKCFGLDQKDNSEKPCTDEDDDI